MSDIHEFLRDFDTSRLENERSREKANKEAEEDQGLWFDAWNALSMAETPEAQAAAVVEVAKLLKSRNLVELLTRIADALQETLKAGSHPEWLSPFAKLRERKNGVNRTACELYLVAILMDATAPKCSRAKLQKQLATPPDCILRSGDHAAGSAHEVMQFIHNARIQRDKEAAAKRKAEIQAIATSVTKRNATFLVWHLDGMKPAAIRDEWNKTAGEELIGSGEDGRETVKKGLDRAMEFCEKWNTSPQDLLRIL